MLEFITNNYMIFVGILVFILLGIIGYIVDKKKYENFQKKILTNTNGGIEDYSNVQNIDTMPNVNNEVNSVNQTSTPNDEISISKENIIPVMDETPVIPNTDSLDNQINDDFSTPIVETKDVTNITDEQVIPQ